MHIVLIREPNLGILLRVGEFPYSRVSLMVLRISDANDNYVGFTRADDS